MISGEYVRKYSTVLLKALDTYSGDTAEIVSDMIVSDETLLKMEELMKDNPTEQELIKMLDENFVDDTIL